MTNITPQELKMLMAQVVLVAIIGVFLVLYSTSPIGIQTVSITPVEPNTALSTNDDIPWNTQLVSETMGLPTGFEEIFIVSSIVLIPLTIMNALTIARLAKDFLTQWV